MHDLKLLCGVVLIAIAARMFFRGIITDPYDWESGCGPVVATALFGLGVLLFAVGWLRAAT